MQSLCDCSILKHECCDVKRFVLQQEYKAKDIAFVSEAASHKAFHLVDRETTGRRSWAIASRL